MDFVTITDHNRIDGALLLKKKYPKQVFVSVETTAYFPEDRCKIHILIYGLTEEQFAKINELRENIYTLRDYLLEQDLAHALAHATYGVNDKLTKDHLEKLILLFDVFEVINGSRDRYKNELWKKILQTLTPAYVAKLEKKHHIRPASTESWIKGFTGGSDDHAGIFIGHTYTETDARSVEAVLTALRQKRTIAGGRHNEFYSLAFAIYKIALDFSKQQTQLPDFALNFLSNAFVQQYKPKNIFKRIGFSVFMRFRKDHVSTINTIIEMLQNSQKPEVTFSELFDKISIILETLTKQSIEKIYKNRQHLKSEDMFSTFMQILPVIFASIPFFSTSNNMYKNRLLTKEIYIDCLEAAQLTTTSVKQKRTLWFTDTINDLNGVSLYLQKQAWDAHLKGTPLSMVTSVPKQKITTGFPPNVINLDSIYDFALPYYEAFLTMHIPSPLKALKRIYDFEPEEIIISTPGPIGLLGLGIAKLFGLPITAIYHTDFENQAQEMTGNESETALVNNYTTWFYNLADTIKVPTQEYLDLLPQRGYVRNKLSILNRRIDLQLFHPEQQAKKIWSTHNIPEDANILLCTGRLSKEKRLDFIIQFLPEILKTHPDTHLVLIGEGPEQASLEKISAQNLHIHFLGRIPYEKLPLYYAAADLFIFASSGDTFGMVVLEAQACGLPALVPDIGGAKELITPNDSGYILPLTPASLWITQIQDILSLRENDPKRFTQMRMAARKTAETYCART